MGIASVIGRWRERRGRSKPSSTATAEVAKEEEEDEFLFPIWPPINPTEILRRREFYNEAFERRLYRAPEGIFEDSPLYGLYRLYEWIMVDDVINMRNELERFWWNRWPVASIPDPGEQGDLERYAVLACIPALIVESFNERNEQGLRRAEPSAILSLEEQLYWASTPKVIEIEPQWTDTVPPLETVMHLPHSQPYTAQLTSFDDPDVCPAFRKRNILAIQPHIHFI